MGEPTPTPASWCEARTALGREAGGGLVGAKREFATIPGAIPHGERHAIAEIVCDMLIASVSMEAAKTSAEGGHLHG